MSEQVEGSTCPSSRDTGLEALRQLPEFRGPVKPRDDHERANDHLALIYESREEQFAAAIPFIRQGLERGERCVYITEENPRDVIKEEMRSRGIDINAALESRQLSIHDEQEIYRRTGEFDLDDTLALLNEAITAGNKAFNGFRVTGEMGWILDDGPDVEDLVKCESKANHLFKDVNGMVLCQYNRERFPSEVIRDVITTHPYLVYRNRISYNSYYTPPTEFFGSGQPDQEVDRLLGTLQEQTDAKVALEEREQTLQRQNEIIADSTLSFQEKLQALFELGCERFDLELGVLAYVDTETDRFQVEYLSDEHEHFVPGIELPLSETYCTAATEIKAAGSVTDPHEEGYDAIRVYQEFGIQAYLGTYLAINNGTDRTFFFVTSEPRSEGFSDDEHAFVQSMGQWVKYELERHQREQFLRKCYAITADPERSFEDKIERLLDLGCEWFDMELGGIAITDPSTDRFEVGITNGDHENLVPGKQYPLSETYCRAAAREKGTCAVTDPVNDGFEGNLCYEQFGVRAYLGSYLEFKNAPNWTFWFVSTEPRADGFSEAEYTFHHLMGQWVKYELERQQREQELRQRTEHLSALIETTPECIKTVAEDGTLLQMNPAGLDMVEADSESDVTGGCVYDLIAPEHREKFCEFNERICQGERGILEFDIIGLEGTRRHMETHASPLHRPDGTIAHVALTRDITEQVERERELERAFDLLEKTERIADVGGWEIDIDTMEVFWTDQIFELLEVSADEEPPLDEALDMYHENDRHIVKTAIEEALNSGAPFDVEVRIRTTSGEVRWLRLQGVPEIVDHEVVSLRGAVQDITERKKREQRLEAVIDRLEASNQRLEQFAYAASHDLQEPIRMVSSYLQLLERRYEDVLDDDGEEFLEYAVDGAERMREMIEGLLAYSRVETRGNALELIDLSSVFDDVVSDLQVQIEESDAEIVVEDLPRVKGDASQLRQVFQNLLENAITYSGDDPPRVHVSAEQDGSERLISVRDEGIGIDPEYADEVFEVFRRLHSRKEYPGSGIGLALCQRIIERHGGEIWVESDPGEGSTFSFTLPALA